MWYSVVLEELRGSILYLIATCRHYCGEIDKASGVDVGCRFKILKNSKTGRKKKNSANLNAHNARRFEVWPANIQKVLMIRPDNKNSRSSDTILFLGERGCQ